MSPVLEPLDSSIAPFFVVGSADAKVSLTEIVQKHQFPATEFHGYGQTKMDAVTCVHLFKLHGATYEPVEHAEVGDKVALVLERTPFYAESGGQVGDRGTIENRFGATVTVEDTIKIGDVIFHLGEVTKGDDKGAFVACADDSKPHRLIVDAVRRAKIASNHTMTHVMNHKLRAVLGDAVAQKGSLVDDEKTRFDYAHHASLSEEEAAKIEELVTADIAADLPVNWEFAPQADALKIHGLRAVFGEKYPPQVRVVSIGPKVEELLAKPDNKEWYDRSVEFCGGTHLERTSDAEGFSIVSEEAVAKGVRRITAITGEAAHKACATGEQLLNRASALKGAPPEQVVSQIAEITTELNEQQVTLLLR